MSSGYIVAFTGEGKLVRKATGYEQEKPKPRYPTSGSPTARAELPAPIGLLVTHRFLRRGFFLVKQSTPLADVIEDLVMLWAASDAGEWRNRIVEIPSR